MQARIAVDSYIQPALDADLGNLDTEDLVMLNALVRLKMEYPDRAFAGLWELGEAVVDSVMDMEMDDGPTPELEQIRMAYETELHLATNKQFMRYC
jgi:hypothetical protein